MGKVDHVQQQVGILQLLERRLEGADEAFGQVADKADGVGDDHLPLERKPQPSGGGVEGGKEQILGKDLALGEGVEQGRLAGIGVADDGDDRHPGADALLATLHAAAGQRLELLLQAADAVAQTAAVGLQLGFARTAAADTAHQARHGGPLAEQARQDVLELRQFHLDLAVESMGATGEDVENQLAAVDHLEVGELGDGADLGWREVLIEDEQGGPELQRLDHHFLDLPLSHQVPGIDLARALLNPLENHDDRRCGRVPSTRQGSPRPPGAAAG
jgi:hypothetical protein